MVISTSGCKSSSCHLQRKFLVNSVNKTLRWPAAPATAAAWAGFLGACKRRGCQLLPNRRAANISANSIRHLEKPKLSAADAFWLKSKWAGGCVNPLELLRKLKLVLLYENILLREWYSAVRGRIWVESNPVELYWQQALWKNCQNAKTSSCQTLRGQFCETLLL